MELAAEMLGQGFPLQSWLRACLVEYGFREALEELVGERRQGAQRYGLLRKPLEGGGRDDWRAGRIAPHLADR